MIRSDGKAVLDIAPPSFGGDVFTDNSICTGLWSVNVEGRGTITETGAKLRLSATSLGWPGPHMNNLAPAFAGDFVAQVDWAAVAWPDPTGADFCYVTYFVIGSTFYVLTPMKEGTQKYYTTYHASIGTTKVAMSDSSGKLRFRRVGTALYADYWDGAAWQNVSQIVHSAAVSNFYFQVGCLSSCPVPITGDLDNFLIIPSS